MKSFLIVTTMCLLFISHHLQAQTPTVGLILNTEEAFNGYTLFNAGPSLSGTLGGTSTTYLINNCGEIINFWRSRYSAGLSCHLDYKGNLVRPIMNRQTNNLGGPGGGGGVEIMNWEGETIWLFDYNEPGKYFQHHDIEPLPNGNILIIAWEEFTAEQMADYGRSGRLVTEHIVEVRPVGESEGQIVWQWHAIDHMVQDVDSALNNYGVVAENPQLIDVNLGGSGDQLHFNSIDYVVEFNLILLSSNYLNEIFIIDHSTTTAEATSHQGGKYGKGGDILYRWGNPINYDTGNSADRQLYRQHGVTWVPSSYNGKPLIAIFNNYVSDPYSNGNSFVSVIEPPVKSDGSFTFIPGTPFAPQSPLIEQKVAPAPIGSSSMGLPNGNFLYCVNQNGEIGEINTVGDLVWQYIIPTDHQGPVEQGQTGRSSSFNAEKYNPDFVGFVGKNLSPKGPIERNPYENDCVIYEAKAPEAGFTFILDTLNKTINLTDTSTHLPKSWLWQFGDGETSTEQNPNYTYAVAGEYEICLMAINAYGENMVCQTVVFPLINSIDNNTITNILLYPQPASTQVYVENPFNQIIEYQIIDLTGKHITSGITNGIISLLDADSGVYFIEISFSGNKTYLQKLLVQ